MATYWRGNVTATNGSAVVTVNSGDNVNIIAPQSLIQIGQLQIAEVESVNTGDQTIVLAQAWGGGDTTADAIAAPVSIAELRNAVTQVENLISATEAITDSYSQFTKDEILPALNAGEVRNAIDVAQKQSSTTDTTAGRGLIVGAFGLGSTTSVDQQADTQNININKFFRASSSASNLPENNSFNMLNMAASNLTNSTIAIPWRESNPQMYFRSQTSAGYSDWAKLYHNQNILGTVSESSGVPTGAIIERGSNANGSYTKYADGTLICTGSISTSRAINSAYFGGFRSGGEPFTFPSSFSSTPKVSAVLKDLTSAFGVCAINTNSTSTSIVFTSIDSIGTSDPRNADIIAIGTWY